MTTCLVCEVADGDPTEAARRLVYTTPSWRGWVLPGFEIPGWVALSATRHVQGLGGLSPVEAHDLGPSFVRLATAIEEVTRAPRLYVSGLGERSPHWHVMFAPRPEGIPEPERGLAYLARGAELVDERAAWRVAGELREVLGA